MNTQENELIKKVVRSEWSQIGVVVITVASLFFWNRTESRADNRELRGETMIVLRAIEDEMKDFHGRLERQDAEFKGRLALQDAEFKAGLLMLEERMKK